MKNEDATFLYEKNFIHSVINELSDFSNLKSQILE